MNQVHHQREGIGRVSYQSNSVERHLVFLVPVENSQPLSEVIEEKSGLKRLNQSNIFTSTEHAFVFLYLENFLPASDREHTE